MTDYTELKQLANHAVGLDESAYIPCQVAFQRAANPHAILALIAENERLKTLRSTTERDLAQELEVWRNGPSCWSCGDTGDVHDMVGEWRGQCDCNAAKLIDFAAERDQLKADNEALRNGLRLAQHWCASALKVARVDSQPSELLDIASLLRHQESDIDAAMGKGERS